MASKNLRLIYVAAFAVALVSLVDGLDPPDSFEAAFQGRCGRASPCSQLCRELHDGTYECGCRPGYALHKDGYSCEELNNSTRFLSDNYIDSEEDVLYQKDASFSAELDIAMVPAKENENVTYKEQITATLSDAITTTPSFRYFQTQSQDDHEGEPPSEESNRNIEGKTAPYYREATTKVVQKNVIQGTPLYNKNNRQGFENDSQKNTRQSSVYEDVLLAPVVKLNSKIEEKGESNGSKSTTDGIQDEDDRTLIVTTLGPSLEQKVPPMSTTGPSHTVSAPRSGCPLGKMGFNCDRASPAPVAPRFSDGSWLALPALRGAYKRVHLHMEFRPTAKDGLLLITGERSDMTGDYLVLLLRRGYVELIFDCGSGPGVVRSDTSVTLNQWNSLTLYRRRWDAWIQLNGGRHIQGRSKGLFSRMTFLDSVYVGGRSNMTGFEKLPVQTGFEGCIRSLNINGRSYNWGQRPRGDAVGGFNIGECSVGGCGRGCLHGGRCLKKCLCPLGFAGDYCETVLDLQVPSFNGSSFLRYPGMKDSALSWLELQVTFKPTANNGLIMYNAHRNDAIGDFFALYLKEGHLEFAFDLGTGQATIRNFKSIKLENWYTVSVSRTGRLAVLTVVSYGLTSDPDESPGLVTSQGLTPGAFTQLSLSQNLYLGGAPQFHIIQRRINISESFSGCIQKVVINDHEHTIVSSALGGVNIDGCPHSCSSNPCGTAMCRPHLQHYMCICNIGDENEKCTTYLNETDVYPRYSPYISHYYSGEGETVRYLQLKNSNSTKHSNIVPKKGNRASLGFHAGQKMSPTNSDSKHEEWDINSKLKAQKEFNENNKEIDDQEWILNKDHIEKEKLNGNTDNSLNYNHFSNSIEDISIYPQDINSVMSSDIPSFEGRNSFIRNNDEEILKRLSSHSVDINIRFKSLKSNGLLLWLGKDGMIPGDTFMSLAIEDGFLTFRYDVGSGEVIITANQTKVDDGLWHRARAERKGQSGVLDIDGLGAIGKVSPGRIKPLNVDTGLYIGGMPSIWPETLGRYNTGLEGCISMLTLDREYQIPISLKSHKFITSRNVGKCPP